MRRTEAGGGGVDGVKNRSEKCKGPRWGGDQRLFEKIKVFLKNQKHEPNIVEITHLCIMHEAHTIALIMQVALQLIAYLSLQFNE